MAIDDGFRLFASECLLKRLQALMAEMEGVKSSEDIEYIHRMRVASRRMRSSLKAFGSMLTAKQRKRWTAGIGGITRALGTARDADVQIEVLEKLAAEITEPVARPGIERLELRLRQKRRKMQSGVIQAITQYEASGLAEEISDSMRRCLVECRLREVEAVSTVLLMKGLTEISLRLEELLSWSSLIVKAENVHELHAMRIAAKRLRYTLELFTPVLPGDGKARLDIVKRIQELLGDIHDCDVWTELLPQFMDEERRLTMEYFGDARGMKNLSPGLKLLADNRRQRRGELYAEFMKLWNDLEQKQTWPNLRAELRAIAQSAKQPLPHTIEIIETDHADSTDR